MADIGYAIANVIGKKVGIGEIVKMRYSELLKNVKPKEQETEETEETEEEIIARIRKKLEA